jgi:hypothetical protein
MMRLVVACFSLSMVVSQTYAQSDDKTVRVFIFAGQSNMEGADSKVEDIDRFPPFVGFGKAQPDVRFSYCLGRDKKVRSDGWVDLQPVRNMVGPELSFARKVKSQIAAPIAIIKVAAGGTHLGGDWNPDEPSGFKMYPLALDVVRSSLAEFDKQGIPYRVEGFMWHQGENDMFNEEYRRNYGANLKNYLASWRRDLKLPKLKFYIGELCTKTIWGMDLRPRMYDISLGQKSVTKTDPLAEYIPTSHIGVEIGNPVGLHYHYGTLGQLEHGVNYADAYLRDVAKNWPEELNFVGGLSEEEYVRKMMMMAVDPAGKVKLFILAGHRNMEGERAFTQQLNGTKDETLLTTKTVLYRYSIGGGVKTCSWDLLHPSGYYNTFGPELSFGARLGEKLGDGIAIAKFTHSGSQMNDWTPEGSLAKSRHLYPAFIKFVKESVEQLETDGDRVEVAGVFYHVGENEMSMHSYRKQAAKWLKSTIDQSRKDLEMPTLKWFVSQQRPTDHKNVNKIDVVAEIAKLAANDEHIVHIKAFDPPKQDKRLVLDTDGIVWLGRKLADAYLSGSQDQ